MKLSRPLQDDIAFRAFADSLLAGEDQATRQLLGQYSARLVSLARRQMSPRLQVKVAPEDVLQSVFRTLFRRLDSGEFELRGWGALWGFLSLMTLRKVRRNVDRYTTSGRDIAREVSLESLEEADDFENQLFEIPDREPTPVEAAIFADEFCLLLSGLDERDRRTVELLFAGEEPVEVARKLQCSQRTLRRTLTRLRKRILTQQLLDRCD